ncbi:hypothetical protein OK016_27370 [Vibrio chagasii]|nr:hypothetical protein [Vibrio chagasii]
MMVVFRDELLRPDYHRNRRINTSSMDLRSSQLRHKDTPLASIADILRPTPIKHMETDFIYKPSASRYTQC